MFGRDNTPTSGLPGSSPSGLGGAPTGRLGAAPSGGLSLAKPSGGGTAPGVPGAPPRPWELGPWSMRLFIVVALAAATFGFSADRKHRQNDPLDQATRGAITTNSQLSFTNSSRLRSAFDAVQSKEPAAKTLLSLNISATEIHGTLLGASGQEFYMSVDASLKPTVRSTDSGTDSPGLPLSKIPFNAASRILNAAQGKFKLNPANLTSLSFSAFAIGDSLGNWNASYRRPFTHNSIQAAFDGTDVRLTGTPDAAARKQMRDAQKQIASAQINASKQLRDARKRIAAAKARARKALAGLN